MQGLCGERGGGGLTWGGSIALGHEVMKGWGAVRLNGVEGDLPLTDVKKPKNEQLLKKTAHQYNPKI